VFKASPSSDLKDLFAYHTSSAKMWAMIFQVKEFWEPFASEYERWVAFATQDNPPPHVRKQLQGTLFYARAFREQWNNLRDRLGHTGFI
jgi:hypothetical protein